MGPRLIAAGITALLMAGCAQPVSLQQQQIYTVPYGGQDWNVFIRIPPGKTRAQAEADGSAQYVVDGEKRLMRCDGSFTDCRNTLVDLRERMGTLGDGDG